MHDVALNALKDGAITQKACDYIAHWAQNMQHWLPRFPQYTCSNHRVTPNRQAPQVIHAYGPRGQGHAPRHVLVAAAGSDGEVLHAKAALCNDANGDQLAIVEP